MFEGVNQLSGFGVERDKHGQHVFAFDDAAFVGDGLEGEIEFASRIFDVFQNAVFVQLVTGKVIDVGEVCGDGVRAEQVGAVLTHDAAHAGGKGRQFRRRFPLFFRAEDQHFAVFGLPLVFAVAAPGGLRDGVRTRLRPHQAREADVHACFDQRGGNEAAGFARCQPRADGFQRLAAVCGAHQGGEVVGAVEVFGAVVEAARVTAVIDDDEELRLRAELFE